MDNFIDESTHKHFIILAGQKIEADVAYQSIYSKVKSSILVIDDYIGAESASHMCYFCQKSSDQKPKVAFCDLDSVALLRRRKELFFRRHSPIAVLRKRPMSRPLVTGRVILLITN